MGRSLDRLVAVVARFRQAVGERYLAFVRIAATTVTATTTAAELTITITAGVRTVVHGIWRWIEHAEHRRVCHAISARKNSAGVVLAFVISEVFDHRRRLVYHRPPPL
jgi:hypothetical protein